MHATASGKWDKGIGDVECSVIPRGRRSDGLLWSHINTRFDAVNTRFDDMRELWRAELRRVEGVLDARLTHLEEKSR